MAFVNTEQLSNNETIVTNLRHFDELQLTLHEIETIISGVNSGLTGDFLAINIRQALFHLGSITGEVTTKPNDESNGSGESEDGGGDSKELSDEEKEFQDSVDYNPPDDIEDEIEDIL